MNTPLDDAPRQRASVSEVMKAVRRHRGLRSADVAAAMGLPIRTYEYFESGAGRLNRERIHQFAEVVNADPFAILTALAIGSPAFARRCADNKLMTLLLMAVLDFDAAAQDDIARLEATALIAAFTRMFGELTSQAREKAAFVEHWMLDKALVPPPDGLD
jgi:transcriptional regulator with XRE-family HTH domain